MRDLDKLRQKHRELGEEIERLEKKDGLPERWEDLESVDGWYAGENGDILLGGGDGSNFCCRNHFATKAQAEASIAMAQLSQLMKVYNDGWEPDWSDSKKTKYVLWFVGGKISTEIAFKNHVFLAFKTEKLRDKFLENFRDLIEQAKPLL